MPAQGINATKDGAGKGKMKSSLWANPNGHAWQRIAPEPLPNNYPPLSQAQRAIRTFEKPNVIIEGHTDSAVNRPINFIVKPQALAGQ